jgi:hypothetical protein
LSEAEALVRLIRAGTSEALVGIAAALEKGDLGLDSSSVGISAVPGVDELLASQAARAFAAMKSIDGVGVATAIRTAVGIREQEQLVSPKVEICWTGPEAEGLLVTPNAAAIKELLGSCSDTGTILLVGYSLTVGKDTFMEQVRDLLIDASKRHAKVQIVLHRDEEGKNHQELVKGWDVFARKPEIYTWQPPDGHKYTKLHAKCLVVDRLQMLVTSANFTFHGLESNIELGLLVRNQPLATAVHDRFQLLINSKVLQPWRDVA